MSEHDERKLRDALDRAKRDPSVSANMRMQLEAQVKKNEKQKLAKLNRDVARKDLTEKQKKLKDELNKKGIQSINMQPDAKQAIEAAKRKAQAEKQQGQTEKPAQTV